MILQPMPYPPAAVGGTDPYWNNVLFLSGFEGTNGSTSFTDESAAAHAITPFGNAAISTAQQKFGAASGTFDGSGDYLTLPSSSDWDFAANKFTVEGWFRFLVKQTNQALLGVWANVTNSWFFYIEGSNLILRTNISGFSLVDIGAAFAPTLGQWYHLAADRDATGKFRVYVNGTMIASNGATANSLATQNLSSGTSDPLVIGAIGPNHGSPSYDFNGQMDELRIAKGAAIYASDAGFTVPASSFPRS
jgi:hypothetical protein